MSKSHLSLNVASCLVFAVLFASFADSLPPLTGFAVFWLGAAVAFYRGSIWGHRLAAILLAVTCLGLALPWMFIYGVDAIMLFGALAVGAGAFVHARKWNPPRDRSAFIFMPSLAFQLVQKELDKGAPLTRSEVLHARDEAIGLDVTPEVAQGWELQLGYRDVDPEHCWQDWPRARQIVLRQMARTAQSTPDS